MRVDSLPLSMVLVLVAQLAFGGNGSAESKIPSDNQEKAKIDEGWALFKAGDFLAAATQMKKSERARYFGQVRIFLEELETVARFIPRATGTDPFETAIRKAVVSFLDGRDPAGAIAAMRSAQSLNPTHPGALALLRHMESGALVEPGKVRDDFECVAQHKSHLECGEDGCKPISGKVQLDQLKLGGLFSGGTTISRGHKRSTLTSWQQSASSVNESFLETGQDGNYINWWWYPKSNRLVGAESYSNAGAEHHLLSIYNCTRLESN